MAFGIVDLVIVLIAAFVPSIIYALWIRNAEIHLREPWVAIAGIFIYGATVAIGLAIILELIILGFFPADIDPVTATLIAAIVVAPIVEELTKAAGLFSIGGRLTEPENGLVYGAASGLGFAATENVLYFITGYLAGLDVFIIIVVARVLTSTLLHASATSLVGFGISRQRCFASWFGQRRSWVPYLIVAILLHAGFNALASFGDLLGSDLAVLVGLGLSLVLVWGVIGYIRRKIKELDRANVEGNIRCT